MYRSLDPDGIVKTLDALQRRIGERFEGADLHAVSMELLCIAKEARERSRAIERPIVWLRISVALLVLLIVATIAAAFTTVQLPASSVKFMVLAAGFGPVALGVAAPLRAQTPPSAAERTHYTGLHAAAVSGNTERIRQARAGGENVDVRDGHGRTPLHVAAYGGRHAIMRALVEAGADPNALDNDDYDIVTIAAVANDLETLKLALQLGASPGNVTSPYQGTALIAAAHLGHVDVVKCLIAAGAPVDHVNNLGWTALIESIVLGDGGPAHVETLRALVRADADVTIGDRQGRIPLTLARDRNYSTMIGILERASAE